MYLNVNPADISHAQAGDEAAFLRLWELVKRYTYRFRSGLYDPTGLNAIEDFEAIAMGELWEKLQEYDTRRSSDFFLRWAYKVVANRLRNEAKFWSNPKRNPQAVDCVILSLSDKLAEFISDGGGTVEDHRRFHNLCTEVIRQSYRYRKSRHRTVFWCLLQGMTRKEIVNVFGYTYRQLDVTVREVLRPLCREVLRRGAADEKVLAGGL